MKQHPETGKWVFEETWLKNISLQDMKFWQNIDS